MAIECANEQQYGQELQRELASLARYRQRMRYIRWGFFLLLAASLISFLIFLLCQLYDFRPKNNGDDLALLAENKGLLQRGALFDAAFENYTAKGEAYRVQLASAQHAYQASPILYFSKLKGTAPFNGQMCDFYSDSGFYKPPLGQLSFDKPITLVTRGGMSLILQAGDLDLKKSVWRGRNGVIAQLPNMILRAKSAYGEGFGKIILQEQVKVTMSAL